MVKKQEIITLLNQAINHSIVTISELQQSDNPQIQEIVITHKAKIKAFKAILDALNGDTVMLKCFTGLSEF
jgi:hypothetical protein